MSDSNSSQKKPGVPSWQLKDDNSTMADDTKPAEATKATIIENAKRFLEDNEIRDASTDKKTAFLEGKGLGSAEIETLLGVSLNAEATAGPAETPSIPQSSPVSQPQPHPQPSSSQPQPSNLPPVITYPEFLTTPNAPAPLVTRSRLLATLYAFAGVTALLYGTKNYVVTPMLEQLTESRHSLAATAISNLQRFVLQLQEVVSEIPISVSEEKRNDESEDEDPNELFHRDVGVQTSRSPSPSKSQTHDEMTTKRERAATTVDEHAIMLHTVNSSLSEMLERSTSEGNESSDLSKTISDLIEYLGQLAYVAPTFNYGVAGGYGAQGNDDDEISRVRASIRGVKGVLLSARSFPSATRAR